MLFRFNLLRILDVSPRSFLDVAFGIQLGSSLFLLLLPRTKGFFWRAGFGTDGRSVGRQLPIVVQYGPQRKQWIKNFPFSFAVWRGMPGQFPVGKKRKKSALFFGDNLHWETIFFKPPRNCRFQDAKLREKSLLKKGPRIIRQVFFLFSLQESSSFSRRNSFFFFKPLQNRRIRATNKMRVGEKYKIIFLL